MVAYKEQLIYFENLMQRQVQIYPDACDVGFILTEAEKSIARKMLMDLMDHYGYRMEKWSGGSTTSIAIPIEHDEGFINTTVLIVSFHQDKGRKIEFLDVSGFSKLMTKEELQSYNSKYYK